MHPAVIVHLGVSTATISDQARVEALNALAIRAADAGFQALHASVDEPALLAVERAVNQLEESGIVNAGRGAVKQADGVQRCDASIMDGSTLDCGAVAGLEGIAMPVSVARRLLDFSREGREDPGRDSNWNFFFTGPHVEEVFRLHGESIPPAWRAGTPATRGASEAGAGCDTVGAIAIDAAGRLAAATSTGGMRGSLPGRVGDSPVIGGGTYASDHAAFSNTGRGEHVMKICAAKRACDLVEHGGMNAMLAVNRLHAEYQARFAGTGAAIGTIGIDKEGNWTAQFTGACMAWAVKTPDGGFRGFLSGEKEPF